MTDKRANLVPEHVQIARLMALVTIVRKILNTIVWLGLFLCTWLSIKEVAGEITIINAVIKYVSNRTTSSILIFLVIVALLIWCLFERALRYRKTKMMQSHIKALEAKFDSERTTSGLTPTGKTNPKDI